MFGEIFSGWSSVLLILLSVCYLLIIQHYSKKQARPRKLNPEELLAKLALIGPDSEYDIFCISAREWNIPKRQIDDDFKIYLLESILPYYVNSHLRKVGKEIGDVYRPPFFPFGRGFLPWLK